MIEIMKKIILLACLFVGAAFSAHAQSTPNLCSKQALMFGFFNGVQTTEEEAYSALDEFKVIYGESVSEDYPMVYDLFYNDTEGWLDFVEVFDQRAREYGDFLVDRLELFFGIGNEDDPWWKRIIGSVSAVRDLRHALRTYRQALIVSALGMDISVAGSAGLAGWDGPSTEENYAEHRMRIDNHALEGRQMLLVAHSQGNLFVNKAHAHAVDKVGEGAVRTVHIAPASLVLNGPHVLADRDLVINGLRPLGPVPSNTASIPLIRPPGRNGATDPLGHGLLEIYLNDQLGEVWNQVNTHILTAIGELETAASMASSQASPGLFTAMLSWSGPGDVDMHVYEPDNTHVYYRNLEGNSGYLDVDNTVGYGSEHYYASCERARIQEGIYTISLANYERAQGVYSTVHVSSWMDGLLGVRDARMGPETGDAPSVLMYRVRVEKDPQTGQYSVSIVD